MYLIAGLGNPGKQYEATRHNMGFDTIDCLVEKHNIPQGGVKFNAMYGKSIIGGEKAILMKPLSYMNLSGGPIQEMSSYFKIDPETELIVMISIWNRDSFVSAKKAVQADITGSRILSVVLELRSLSVSVLVLVRNRKTGIWQILCWVIFRTATASLWTRELMMRQRP